MEGGYIKRNRYRSSSNWGISFFPFLFLGFGGMGGGEGVEKKKGELESGYEKKGREDCCGYRNQAGDF